MFGGLLENAQFPLTWPAKPYGVGFGAVGRDLSTDLRTKTGDNFILRVNRVPL
jgi:hypothetical protein